MAFWIALTGCSSSNEVRKEQPPAPLEEAPAVFQVNLDTSKGAVAIEVPVDI